MRFLKPLFSPRFASQRLVAVAHHSLVAFALGAASFGPSAAAQDAAATNLSDDVAFARSLARYRYFDLAISWLDDLEKGGKLDAAEKSELGLARAMIARIASQFAASRDDRKKYFDEAITLYRAAIGGMQELDADKGEDVIDGLCATLIDKGKFWAEELLRLRTDGAGDADQKVARANAEDAFKEAVKTLNQAADLLSQAAGGSNVSAATVTRLEQLSQFALYRKGEAYYNWAATYDASEFSREDNLKKCIEAMNDYIWEAGNESIWAFWSSYYMGVAEFELSRGSAAKNYGEFVPHHEKALAMLTHTFEADGGVSLDSLAEQNLPENELSFILEVVERAYLSTAQVYRAAANNFEALGEEPKDLDKFAQMYAVTGDQEGQVKPPVARPALVAALRTAGINRIDELKARFDKHKFGFGDYGYRAMLEQSGIYVDLGVSGKAVETVSSIAQKQSGTLVGLQAQAMLSQLLESGAGGGAQSAQVWNLSATGALSEARYADAIENFHSCISAASTPEEKKQYVVGSWQTIGNCYLQLSRHLEAALAFEQGLEAARSLGTDDLVSELAIDCYNAWSSRFIQTKDAFDQAQRDRVRKIVTDLGASPDIQYFVARETFANAQAEKDAAKKNTLFSQAETEFQKVTDASLYFERALVYQARCQNDAGNPDKSIATFATFFKRVDDPSGGAPEGKRAKNREIARAEAVYYRAGVLLLMKKDFANALKSLDGYEKTFPNQQLFYPLVQNYRAQAQIGLGKRAEAEAIVIAMLKDSPTHAATTSSLNQLATAYSEAARTARDAKNDAELELNIAKAAEYLGKHNERSGYASFANLRYVADWYTELSALAKKKSDDAARDAAYGNAKENYVRLIDKFGKNASYAKTIETEVMAGYGTVLIGLQDFPNAAPIWRKLYDTNRRNQEAAENHAKCLGGWIEFSNRKFLEHTGTGQHKEAALVWADLRKALELANQKHTPSWWFVSTQLVYELYLSGKTNPADSKEALNIISNWKALLPELGGTPSKECILRVEVELQKK